jgi:hypothetical protein
MKFNAPIGIFLLTAASLAGAAPDEDKLGKGYGYPIGNAHNWY